MSPLFSSWYQPAHWPVIQQWFLLLLSSSVLVGGLGFGLSPRWQQYQQLISDTRLLLQQLAALPPYALLSPNLTTVTITPIKPATALATLLQRISELADQQALTLLAIQQPSGADQSRSQSTQLIVEVMGSYQPLLNFLIALGTTRHPLTIDTLMLQREEQTSDITLTLGLSLTEPTEASS